ncbi:MAG: hypothetical protein ACPLUL_05885 [Thermanaerothrix sp.]|uniref:hypothetical protein n=1 Tax=Thermanaerothrix sp. TaxID=2972675 RepID=UPI003C79E550
MRNSVSMGIRVGLLIIGALLLGLALWPSRTTWITLHPDLEWLSNQPEGEDIQIDTVGALSYGQLVIGWPQRLRPREWGKISLNWVPGVSTPLPSDPVASPLRLVLTVRLEINGGYVEPAGIWREVVDLRKGMTLTWRLMSQTDQPIRGTLWIYAQTSSVEGVDGGGLPILAWPFTIHVATPLGVSNWIWVGLGGLMWVMALTWQRWWMKRFS